MVRLIVLIAVLFTAYLSAATVQCKIENERIYCTYHLDRSDNQNGKSVEFHWISPQSPKDDRIRHFDIPPRYRSITLTCHLPFALPGKKR